MSAVAMMPPLRRRIPHVMVVEDERRLRELLCDVIPQMGFPVSGARSAEEALSQLASESPDIFLIDLMLPGVSGLDFLDRIRAEGNEAQVIIMTAYGTLELAQRAIRAGVSDFLTKPSPLGEIEAALDRARRRWAEQSSRAGEFPTHDDPASPFHDSADSSNSPYPPPLTPSTPSTNPLPLSEVERQQILAALARHQGNRTAAAAELGISRRTLHYRLVQYRQAGYEID